MERGVLLRIVKTTVVTVASLTAPTKTTLTVGLVAMVQVLTGVAYCRARQGGAVTTAIAAVGGISVSDITHPVGLSALLLSGTAYVAITAVTTDIISRSQHVEYWKTFRLLIGLRVVTLKSLQDRCSVLSIRR